ncbi:MAG: MFS transporter [Chloroflexi bacterium]|jgi:MFS family permease|nr:MFS transporter [Chloroflexota bacterium]
MQEKTYQVGRGMGITILIVLCLLQLSDWADRSILAISLQAIKTAFNLTDAQAGMLPSLLQVGVALFLIPSAVLADRFARRKVIMGMALIWSVFTIVTGLATQLWQLLLARFMVGTGEAGYQPAGQTWLGLTFPKQIRTRILAIFMMCMPIGVALGLFLGGYLLNLTGDWRAAFFVFGIPGVILAIIAFFLPDYKAARPQGEGALSKAYFKQWGDLFKVRSYWLFIITTTLLFFLVFAIQAWIPTAIMRTYDMDPLTVGTVMGAVGLLNLLAPISGLLADRWQMRSKIGRPLFLVVITVLAMSSMLVSILLVGKISFESWLPAYIVSALLLAFMVPVMNVLVHDVIPVPVRAVAVGILLAISQLGGGVLGPVFVGVVSDATGGGAQGIINGLFWTIPVAALSIVTTLLMTKYYAADSAKISDVVMAER